MKIAVLGCGSIGRRHLENLQQLGYQDLLAYDPRPSVRQQVAAELGVERSATLAEVWSRKPEVALVTAPTDKHVELALAAARHQCHLFIEKPLSYALKGLEELVQEVERRGLITMVACNMRFHPGPMTIKRLLAEEAVGRTVAARMQTGSYLPAWRPWQDYRQSYSASPLSGGAILDCIHEIDLALWYFGPARVVGAASLPASAIGLDTDGLAEILLRHESGVLSNVHVNFVQRDYRRTCQVIGTEGTISWDFNDQRVLVYGADGKIAQEFLEPEGWQVNQMYLDGLAHFLKSVKQRLPTINPISGGLAALRLALAARPTQF